MISPQNIQIVTERGNVFVPSYEDSSPTTENDDNHENSESQNNDNDDNAEDTISGFGVTNRLIYKEYGGNIIHASNRIGVTDSLQPYNTIDRENVRFAAAIASTDDIITINVPEFYSKYTYTGNGQIEYSRNDSENILFYGNQRTITGNITASQNYDEITVEGAGRLILEINPYNMWMALKATLSNNTTVRIVESPHDLIEIPYSNGRGGGFLISDLARDPSRNNLNVLVGSVEDSVKTGHFEYDQNAQVIVYHGKCCKGRYLTSGSAHQYVTPDLVILPDQSGYLRLVGDNTDPVRMDINSIKRPGAKTFRVTYNTVTNFDHKVYDTLPVKLVKSLPQDSFEGRYLMQSGGRYGQKYLVIDSPDGSRSTIRGNIQYDNKLLVITGLLPDTAYRVVGDGGRTIAAGTTHTDGLIQLYGEDIFSGRGGYVELYPDSPTWTLGKYGRGTIVFDHVNTKILMVPYATSLPDDKAYNVHAYAKIPITGQNVSISEIDLQGESLVYAIRRYQNGYIEKIYRDHHLGMPYLAGEYSTGQSLYIPIVPTYDVIHMTIGQTPVSLAVEDLIGGSNIRIADTVSSTVNIVEPEEFTHSISATAGAVTFIIANTDGNAKAHIQAVVSGRSEITNTRLLTSAPPPPPPPRHTDPLTTWIEVYVNGELREVDGNTRTQVFFSDEPLEDHRSGADRSSTWYTANFEYPSVRVEDTISIPVEPADFVEVYFYVRIDAQGSVPETPAGFLEYARKSSASATATLRYASISVSM